MLILIHLTFNQLKPPFIKPLELLVIYNANGYNIKMRIDNNFIIKLYYIARYKHELKKAKRKNRRINVNKNDPLSLLMYDDFTINARIYPDNIGGVFHNKIGFMLVNENGYKLLVMKPEIERLITL